MPIIAVASMIGTAAATIATLRGDARSLRFDLRALSRAVDKLTDTLTAVNSRLNDHGERIVRLETKSESEKQS